MAKEKRTLVIGDTHGHSQRLAALLEQEGIIASCGTCAATGDVGDADNFEFCPVCRGSTMARVNYDVDVVHLGDLGHIGRDTQSADSLIYRFVPAWIDILLWGNHDRAARDRVHIFGGYQAPMSDVIEVQNDLEEQGRLKLAHAANGFLLTHAGLTDHFGQTTAPFRTKRDAQECADWLNKMERTHNDNMDRDDISLDFLILRDSVGYRRGGNRPFGGILWRDASEDLYDGFRQVFGHTRDSGVRLYEGVSGKSYCIDIGSQFNGCLAGLWLPDEEVVEVEIEEFSVGVVKKEITRPRAGDRQETETTEAVSE